MSDSKICTIVGMGPGLSFAIARRFAKEGFSLALIGRREQDLQRYASELTEFGVRTLPVVADASKPDELLIAIERAQSALGNTEVLIYNAAFMRDAALLELTAEDLHEDFAVNVSGALTAANAIIQGMRAAGRGSLLFTGGGLSLYQMPRMGALAIGKAGIRTLALTLAKELAPEGIHAATVTVCGSIQPGTFYSPEAIAEQYWLLHQERPTVFTPEVVYSETALKFELHYQSNL